MRPAITQLLSITYLEAQGQTCRRRQAFSLALGHHFRVLTWFIQS